ncbi:MAG: glycosyltransferase family 4 protein [Vagococcus sp.]|nr:glycosyltransferase family 4 protein [Vagococcus sp.]
MHILILSQLWEPEEGVPQRRWSWLADTLIRAGHTVDVICPPPHYPGGQLMTDEPVYQAHNVQRVSKNMAVYRTAFREYTPQLLTRIYDQGIQMLSATRIAMAAAKNKRPDLVIATAPPLPTIFTQLVIARMLNIPRIIDLRDAWPDLFRYMLAGEADVAVDQSIASGIKKMVILAVARITEYPLDRSVRSADGVIASTNSFAKILKGRGCPHVSVIRNVASVKFSDSCAHEVTSNEQPLKILYAGTTGRAQGLSSSLRAVKKATDKGADIRMRIVGGGAHLRTLKRNALRLGIPVTFYQRVPFYRMPRHYQWADTELIQLESWKPLEWTVPSKLYDALKNRRHITLVAKGESADIVRDLKAGHCFYPGDEDTLADHFYELWKKRSKLVVGDKGEEWIRYHGNAGALGAEFLGFVENVCKNKRCRVRKRKGA